MADRRGTGISSRRTGPGESWWLCRAERRQVFIRLENADQEIERYQLSEFLNYPTEVPQHQVLVRLVALGMLEGALKCGRHNYRVIPVRASVCYDPTERHFDYFWESEDIDPEAQLSRAISSLTVFRDAMIRGNWVDDRPPRSAPG